MNRLNLINIEWNCYNGFIFRVLELESYRPNLDSALLGLNFSKRFLYVDLLFFHLKVFDRNESERRNK